MSDKAEEIMATKKHTIKKPAINKFKEMVGMVPPSYVDIGERNDILNSFMKPDLFTKQEFYEELSKPDSEKAEDLPISNEDDIEFIRKSLVIQRSSERIRVTAIAIDVEDPHSNELNSVRTLGDPLGCYAYNSVQDVYYVNCVQSIDLGPISVSYRLKTPVGVDTNHIIALPDEVIEKYLSPTQKKNLKVFREKFKAPRYNIKFMQAINC